MRYIIILLLALCCVGNAYASEEIGTNVVVLEQPINDSCFSLYNHGTVTYMIYAYNYSGSQAYKKGFVGAIEPNEIGVLNTNSSYYVIADYDTIRDLENVEKAKSFFNRYWLIFIILIIVLVALVSIVRNVIR